MYMNLNTSYIGICCSNKVCCCNELVEYTSNWMSEFESKNTKKYYVSLSVLKLKYIIMCSRNLIFN